MMRIRIALLLVLLAPALAAAESPWRLGIALGYGERSNPLVLSEDVPLAVDIDIAWFGERFFFDNGDVGLTFVDNASVTASLMGRFNSDRIFFGRTDTRFFRFDAAGAPLEAQVELVVPDRDYAIEGGVELLTDGRWGLLQLSAFHDVSGTHEGYELEADYGIGFGEGSWYIEPSIGISYKSKDLNNYYWGVRPEESSAVLPAYEAGDGVNTRARLRVAYYFSRHLSVALLAEYERLNDEAAASPIVEQRGVLGYFAGVGYRF